MQEQPKKLIDPGVQQATAELINQATAALKKAVRDDFTRLKIPLNTSYEIRPASDLEDIFQPITREVWVNQIFPVKRKFLLITEVLKVVITPQRGAEMEQNLTHHEQ